MKLKLIILFIIISSILFSANFEFGIGGSVGATSEFSYVLDRKESYMASGLAWNSIWINGNLIPIYTINIIFRL